MPMGRGRGATEVPARGAPGHFLHSPSPGRPGSLRQAPRPTCVCGERLGHSGILSRKRLSVVLTARVVEHPGQLGRQISVGDLAGFPGSMVVSLVQQRLGHRPHKVTEDQPQFALAQSGSSSMCSQIISQDLVLHIHR